MTSDFLAQPFLHKQITIVEGMSVKEGTLIYAGTESMEMILKANSKYLISEIL